MTYYEELELFEERAAIMEYCGGMSRDEAEYRAHEEIRDRRNKQKELFDER